MTDDAPLAAGVRDYIAGTTPWTGRDLAQWLSREALAAYAGMSESGNVWLLVNAVYDACRDGAFPVDLKRCINASAGAVLHVDHVIDDEGGMHRVVGVPMVGQLANALIGYTFELIATADLPTERSRLLARLMRRGLALAMEGQEREIAEDAIDEAAYWRICEEKSEAGFGALTAACAVFAERPEAEIMAWERVGAIIGRLTQIVDDVADAMAEPPAPDWRRPRRNLVFLYAIMTGGGAALEHRIKAAADGDAAMRAALRDEMIAGGAMAYAHYVGHAAAAAARAAVAAIDPPRPATISARLAAIEARFD